jgi:hypothetical protein
MTFWGLRDPKGPIWIDIIDIHPKTRFLNLFGEFSPLRAAGNFLTLAALASRDWVESNYEIEFGFFCVTSRVIIEKRDPESLSYYCFCRKWIFYAGQAADHLFCNHFSTKL